jgi:hypothetical protein
MTTVSRHRSRSLVAWSTLLLATLAAHDLTHALDDGLKTSLGQLALIAIPQWLVLAAVMAVIVRADRARSAAAATLLGIGVTVGFAVAHLLPFAGAPYWDLDPSAVSWLLAWLPAALGLALAALAWPQWREAATPRRRRSSPRQPPSAPPEAHPPASPS